MDSTTIKVSVATRDRIKAFGGATHEETIIAALDALEAERFWSEAEAGKRWLDSQPDDVKAAHRAEMAEIDRLFGGIG